MNQLVKYLTKSGTYPDAKLSNNSCKFTLIVLSQSKTFSSANRRNRNSSYSQDLLGPPSTSRGYKATFCDLGHILCISHSQTYSKNEIAFSFLINYTT